MSRVMLIEDDEMMRSLLQTLLQLEGFDVVPATGYNKPDEIIEMIRQEKPAIILLDVNLRRTNGFDILRSLRMQEDLKNIQVIMSSGMDFSAKSQEQGADGFLLKPYMPDDLIRTLRQNLGN